MLGGPQEELTVLPYHLSVPFWHALSQPVSEYERGLNASSADFPNNWVRILMEDSSGHFINVASNVDLGNEVA